RVRADHLLRVHGRPHWLIDGGSTPSSAHSSAAENKPAMFAAWRGLVQFAAYSSPFRIIFVTGLSPRTAPDRETWLDLPMVGSLTSSPVARPVLRWPKAPPEPPRLVEGSRRRGA